MEYIRLSALNCGWFHAPASFFVRGAGQDKWRGPVPAFLIEHPRGNMLFDAGMNMRFKQLIGDSPFGIAGYGIDLEESEEIGARLLAIGVDPAHIDYVALSHLHHDHCSGLSLIPNATLLIQREEYDYAMANDGRAFDSKYDSSFFALGHAVKKIHGEFDVFGDGTVTLFPTPGHTPGHQSARIRLAAGDVVLASDCCYTVATLDDLNTLAKGSVDREQHLRSLQLLRDLRNGGGRIICGHDPADRRLTVPAAIIA